MAKRIRLEPDNPKNAPSSDLEVKGYVNGWVGVRPRAGSASIADVTREAAEQAAFKKVAEELRSVRKGGRLIQTLPFVTVPLISGHPQDTLSGN